MALVVSSLFVAGPLGAVGRRRPGVRGPVNEAEQYLAMQPASHDIDVLQWWAEHKSAFPHLSRMACQFLSVPATFASAERVFSLAGRIFSDLTRNQNDTTLEGRMWAKVHRKSVIE